MDAVAVAAVLGRYRFAYQCEEDLQRAIASALSSASIPFVREAELGPQDRIDFLLGTLGIEVKIKGSPTEVARQINRYTQSDQIKSLLLVTSKSAHRSLPSELNGKEIKVLYLNPLAGS